MKRLSLAVGLAFFSHLATSAEEWSFVHVARSTELTVVEGAGHLERNGGVLSGTLQGLNTVEYQIRISLDGGQANGWFGAHESDDGGTHLEGTITDWEVPGGHGCWQTIQLFDRFHSVTLARNHSRCVP
jgi:hypothetical protein